MQLERPQGTRDTRFSVSLLSRTFIIILVIFSEVAARGQTEAARASGPRLARP